MKMLNSIEPTILRELLKYGSDTGKLYWKERNSFLFIGGEGICNRWNSRYAGKEAFTSTHRHGYRYGRIFDKAYLAHRVIWTIVHGKWPEDTIDHINGVPDDNRLDNLRAVSHQENCKNRKQRRDNTSGTTGVYWDKRGSRWQAKIQVDGVFKHLGTFVDKDKAIKVRSEAEVKYCFHPNHGRLGIIQQQQGET